MRLAALSVARSNGKSLVAGKLARDYLLGENRDTECLIVAADFRQGKIILGYLAGLLRREGHQLTDRKRWSYRDSVNHGLIRDLATGQAVRVMPNSPKALHGRVFGLCLIDEPREHQPASRDDVLAAITSGMGKVPDAQVIALGTMPVDPDHWFVGWCEGEADFVQVHAAPREAPPFWLKTIRRANPSYDHLPTLRADLQARREKARKFGDAFDEWRARHLNQGTADRTGSLFLDDADWEAVECDALPARSGPTIWGCDPGGSSAFSAIVCYWPKTGRLEGLQCVGGRLSVRERAREDKAGRAYEAMAAEGSLIVQDGRRRPALGQFLRGARARFGSRPVAIVTDNHRFPELEDAVRLAGLGDLTVFRGSRWSEQTEDIRRAQKLIWERRVAVERNVAWSHAIGGSRIEHWGGGNMRLAVGTAAGRKRRARTDLVSALVHCLAEADRRWPHGIVRRRRIRLVAV